MQGIQKRKGEEMVLGALVVKGWQEVASKYYVVQVPYRASLALSPLS